MSLRERLLQREREAGPIRVGLIGAGQMGTGLMSQMEKMDGMKVVAVADILPDRAEQAYQEAEIPSSEVVGWSNAQEASQAIQNGKRLATKAFQNLVELPEIDVVIESTGIPSVGASACYHAILARKHVVNMNVEADATIGYYLASLAQSAGVVYTLAAGDEPGSIKEIYDFADALGFDIIAVGKGKNNPLNRSVTPDDVAEQAKQKNMSAKMLASFVDGTKTMVEMTSIGNGIGFAPEVRGAHGPKCTVAELPEVFVPKADGGILDGPGAVDYAIGPAPGVFVIITTDHPKIRADLRYLRLSGHGNYWALYRPYHLANLETPISVARAVLYGEETLATHRPPVAETITMSKRALKAGERIDALGGFTVYGLIEKAEVARKEGLVPLGLSVGGVVRHDLQAHEPIRFDDLEPDETSLIYWLRRLQDEKISFRLAQ